MVIMKQGVLVLVTILNKANELHQNLLLKLKPVEEIGPDKDEHLYGKYGTVLKQNGHQMQSLDYHVIDKVLAFTILKFQSF